MAKGAQGPGGNQGIQGNVVAEVLAVGKGARATKTVTVTGSDKAELATAIDRLQKAIAALPVSPQARAVLATDAGELEKVVQAKKPDAAKVSGLLERISGKVKMLGEITKDVTGIVSPLVKIAGVFHLSTAVLGLL